MGKSTEEELARYQQLRAIQRNLHHMFLDWLPKNALEECGKVLGIYRKGTLVFNSEDETSVLMDYCIYDYRWDGQNVIERYAAQASIEPGSDEKIILDAMLEARYSLFAVDEVVRGVGIQTHDLLRGDRGFIIDIALGETAVKNLVLAGRVITPSDGEFSMTTGAALPANATILEKIANEIPKRFGERISDIAKMSPEKAAELSAFVIRVFLEGNASSRMSYEDVTKREMARARPKVGRNDPCPCGSGKKYKKCCGAASEPVPLPDRRLMERNLRSIEKLMAKQDFGSVDEMNAYLKQFNTKGRFPEWIPETPMEQAQELIYQALETAGKKERIRLAIESLKICDDCADAYVLLAEEAAEIPEQARNWYQRGVEASERALGPEVFAKGVGHFWGLIETRPYMRAREGLADCLFSLGERDVAIEHYRDMLRLNPNDNQGIRYKLLSCLMERNDIDAAKELLGQYKNEYSADWFFMRALITFIQHGASREANKQLRKAVKQNPHVVPYLLGERKMPLDLPDRIGFGDEDEAISHAAEFADVWLGIPGALEWIKATTQGKR
jgi:tetratricopeptide (TPR) repeat protein